MGLAELEGRVGVRRRGTLGSEPGRMMEGGPCLLSVPRSFALPLYSRATEAESSLARELRGSRAQSMMRSCRRRRRRRKRLGSRPGW